MESIWMENSEIQQFDSLQEDTTTDVLIIGGGMAGVLCAYLLEQAGVNYLLVEADRICKGITKHTTAKITSQHGLIYHKLMREFGEEQAGQYLCANEWAVNQYTEICRNISCDFETKDAFVYSLDHPDHIEKELTALQRLGAPAQAVDCLPLPFSIAGAIRFSDQAQFHPLKFVTEMVKGLHIYEHTVVRELLGTVAITDNGTIKADKIIVATHFPFLNKHGSYFLKLYQHRSYVLALENAPDVKGMYVEEGKKGMSFRNAGECLLVGGGGHRTGKMGGNFRELEEFVSEHYPEAVVKYKWATQDCMSLDGVPYIGSYSARTEHLYVATGFNKWGMTSSMVAALLLTDLVQEKESPFSKLFSPSRSILRPQLALNFLEASAHLLIPTTKRCPHMGCALKWNKVEQSWDCACHGSRFTKEGKKIDNPANGDL